MLHLHFREEERREAAQAKAQRDCDGDVAQLGAPARAPAPVQTADHLACRGGVQRDAVLRHRAYHVQSGQYTSFPGKL